MSTVNVDSPGIDIVEAPNPKAFDMEVEIGTCSEMQRLVLSYGNQGDLEQVWSTYDVTLELDVVRLL